MKHSFDDLSPRCPLAKAIAAVEDILKQDRARIYDGGSLLETTEIGAALKDETPKLT
jgi:hypothetical protein